GQGSYGAFADRGGTDRRSAAPCAIGARGAGSGGEGDRLRQGGEGGVGVDDFADHDQRRRLEAGGAHARRQLAEGAAYFALGCGGGGVHDGGGGAGGQAVGDQLAADDLERAEAHVDHHRLVGAGEGGPVEVDRVVLQVAGGEHQGLG